MSVLDALREKSALAHHDKKTQAAVKLFLQQKKSIIDIRESTGFEEIINYLERGIEACDNTLDKVDGVVFARVKGERDSYRKLRTFLKNLAKDPPENEEDAD